MDGVSIYPDYLVLIEEFTRYFDGRQDAMLRSSVSSMGVAGAVGMAQAFPFSDMKLSSVTYSVL